MRPCLPARKRAGWSVPSTAHSWKGGSMEVRTVARGVEGERLRGPERAPIRVVVAEDSYIIREFLADTLSAAPNVELVAVCCNARELERAIEIWSPDVVLTDIRMPPSDADEGIRIAA